MSDASPPPPPPNQGSPSAPVPPPMAPGQSREAGNWSMFVHLAGLVGILAPIVGHIGGPLLVWLLKKDTVREVDMHGKEALNFQISFAIYAAVGWAFAIVSLILVIGFLLIPLMVVVSAVFYVVMIILPIVAGLQAQEGKVFRYPLTLRMIR